MARLLPAWTVPIGPSVMYQAMLCAVAATDSALARVLALALVAVVLLSAVVVTSAVVVSLVSFLL